MSHVEHDVVGAPMLNEGAQLVFEIFGLLSGETRYGVVAIVPLGRYAMAIFAVTDLGLHISRKTDSVLCADRTDQNTRQKPNSQSKA
jgi:hypothetical protein